MVEGLEDWEMWIQLLNKHSIVHKLNEELFFYRRTGSSRNKSTANKKTFLKLKKYIHSKHFKLYQKLSKVKESNSRSLIQKIKSFISCKK